MVAEEPDKNEEVRKEALQKQQNKSELEQTVAAGIQGGLELKKEEKKRFLGEFRERVLVALTGDQVEKPGTYSQVVEAIKEPEAEKLIIDQRIDMDAAREYIKLARNYDLSFKKVSSPDLEGPVKLVVVSDRAANRSEIFVKDRADRLKEKGLPEELIKATGEKVCADCYQLIVDQAPEEAENYRQFSWLDKLLGAKCPNPHDKTTK